MNEDAIYRTSTQYKYWSFTPSSLAALRAKTNIRAAKRVKEAIARVHTTKTGTTLNDDTTDVEFGTPQKNGSADKDINCLTAEEELKLVGYYCVKIMELSEVMNVPTNVKATAVQYLKRFYLRNSPMTFHPKAVLLSALYLATKTDNHYIPLKKFAAQIPKTTPELVIATEFIVTQGLLFTFDVRHPQRGLEGGFMELLAIASGQPITPALREHDPQTLQRRLTLIALPDGGISARQTTEDIKNRIRTVHGKAKDILKTSALLTDVYFHYTPSQIWLAALFTIDKPLTTFYLEVKLSSSVVVNGKERDLSPLHAKLTATLESCAKLLSSPTTPPQPSEVEMAELTRIGKKLYHCMNPEKKDLVALNRAQKREGASAGVGKDDDIDEKIIKKRRLEREKLEREGDVFGGDLVKGA